MRDIASHPRLCQQALAGVRPWLMGISAIVYSGCVDNACDQVTDVPVRYTDGTTNASRTTYESSTANEWPLRFAAGRKIRMMHGLGKKPTSFDVYVSLLADGGDQVPSAGNLSLVNTTDSYIQVQNDTCTDLFVRVVAFAETGPADAGAPGSSSQSSASSPLLDAAPFATDAAAEGDVN